MEIYVESPQNVTIEMPLGYTAVTTSVTINGSSSSPTNPISSGTTYIVAKIPYAATVSEGDGYIEVKFTVDNIQYTKQVPFSVVTPYLTYAEAIKILGSAATLEEYMEAERVVRYIINSHCGQSFGKRTKSQIAVGAGETALKLPERLISITGIQTLEAVLNPLSVIIIADGWYLKKRFEDVVSELTTTNVYWNGESDSGHGVVISAPGSQAGIKWKDDYPFTIAGTWGYAVVPFPIKEAAKLLMNDYACSEQAYRDRYLDSIKSADWRLQYNDKAFLHTGNVRADQLLNDYVMKFGWALI